VGWEGKEGIRIRNVVTKQETVLEHIDLVVGLVGSTSVSSLADDLHVAVENLHVIGDAQTPRTVEEATYEGARLGRLL
jgi:hypothetical protein